MQMRTLIRFMVLTVLAVSFAPSAQCCVGKVLHIGIVATPEEKLLAELISQIITERTGTTVKISEYHDSRQIYEAIRKGDIGLFIEKPDAAMVLLGRSKDANRKSELETVRKEYRKVYNLVWLDSVPSTAFYTPVLSTEILSQLPALPKLINKLPGALSDDGLQKLLKTARGNESSRKVARDFLKAKKLI